MLLFALQRAMAGRRRAWVAVALVAGVLPWVHLTAAGPVAAAGLATLAWTVRTRSGVRDCLAAFAAGALVCALLYLPAAGELGRYVSRLGAPARSWTLAWPEVVGVLGGTRALGWWLVAGGSAGLVVLALTEPRGTHVAAARYLVVGHAPLLLGAAYLVFAVVRAQALTGVVGLALVALQLARGPLDRTWLGGAFACAPELLDAGHALDAPFAGTPALYAELARAPRGLVVVEFPCTDLGALLLRNYALQHGQRTLVGTGDATRSVFGADPYVPVHDVAVLAARADWLIVHLDIAAEYDAFRRATGLPRSGGRPPVPAHAVERMIAVLGEPAYRDDVVWAWRFARGAGEAPAGLLSSPR